jgi:hypothetical protein
MTRDDFELLLGQHRQLIRLANELEYHLYRMGGQPDPGPVTDCQQAAGALIGLLRTVLFRHDQQLLPVLEMLTGNEPLAANRREGTPEDEVGYEAAK